KGASRYARALRTSATRPTTGLARQLRRPAQDLVTVDAARHHRTLTGRDNELLRTRRGQITRRIQTRHRRATVIIHDDETARIPLRRHLRQVVERQLILRTNEARLTLHNLTIDQTHTRHPVSLPHPI